MVRRNDPIFVPFIALFFAASCATPALAQQYDCNDRKSALKHLADKYRETPVAAGVTNGGGLVEVLTSKDGQTWTIIVSTPDGLTCFVAAGEGWRAFKRATEGSGT